MPREHSIGIRLSEDDRERLQLEASTRGLTLSGYIRSRILAGPDDQANYEAIQKLAADHEELAQRVLAFVDNFDRRLSRLESLAEDSDY